MTPDQEVRDLHLRIVRAARRRQADHNDVEDPKEFDQIMEVIEDLGTVATKAARAGSPPKVVGRAMLYYAKCIANMTEGGAKGIVPEDESGD